MPPKAKITREDIMQASLGIVRAGGMEALNARALAQALGCSTQPIFHLYETMEEVREDVVAAAMAYYHSFFEGVLKQRAGPRYKASAWGYIQFAKEEKELFRILFMRERTPAQMRENEYSFVTAVQMVMEATGFDEAVARKFHLEMWVYTHGIATLVVTSFLELSDDQIGDMLADAHGSLKKHYEARHE